MTSNLKAAVILSGCGHLDGTEIREAVIALLELDRHQIQVQCFAPDITQTCVKNHLTKQSVNEERNCLVESARIARGQVQDLSELHSNNFDMLIIPGGFGAATNLSDIFADNIKILPKLKKIIHQFFNDKKPIGAICIAPAIVVAALQDIAQVEVTIGDDDDNLIAKLGGRHKVCITTSSVHDKDNNIFSCSAYMRNDSLYNIYLGIKHMIDSLVDSIKN